MKKRIPFVIAIIAGFVLTVAATVSTAADDCSALGGVINGSECQVTGAVTASDAAHGGPFTINETLRITGAGRITVPPAGGGNPFTLRITGDLIMDLPTISGGSRISGDVSTTSGVGATINVNATGSIVLAGNGTTGSRISSNQSAGSCTGGGGGDISLSAGTSITVEKGAQVTSTAICAGGEIIINAGLSAVVNGLVSSEGTSTVARGGPVAVAGACGLTVGDSGVVQSKGRDPGADLVHLQGGCDVLIQGKVISSAPGHQASPENRCHAPSRPDKPANAAACVEVWSGGALTVDATSTHLGEINADTSFSGGVQCCSWIDLYAAGDVKILGDTAGAFAVHANQALSSGFGGLITVKSTGGDATARGRAIQAGDTAGGGDGGNITVEAQRNVTLDDAQIFAQGDLNATGGFGNGGLIGARAFCGALSWKDLGGSLLATGDVQPTGSNVPAAQQGVITLTASTPPDTAGTSFPVTSGAATTPTSTATGACASGAAPTLPDYVVLPPCFCNSGGLPNLAVSKTTTTPSVSAGDDVGFTVTVSNNGAATATNVTLSDPLPSLPGISWFVSPPNAACSINSPTAPQTLICAFGDLAPGATPFSVHVSSHTTADTSGTLSNTATARADNNPPVSSTAVISVNKPGPSVSKKADATTVSAGSDIGYTITVSNSGPAVWRSVTLNDSLPSLPGISWFVSPVNAACSINSPTAPQTLSCTFGDLAAGNTRSVHVSSHTTAATSGTINNIATAGGSNAPPVSTPPVPITINAPAVTVTKTADSASVSRGDQIGFRITVRNAGPGVATGVTLSDPLPNLAGLKWTMSPSTAGCTLGATAPQTLSCAFGNMAAGISKTVHVISPTTTATPGSVSNTATAAATNSGPVPPATATITVNPPAVTVTKTADNASVNAGSPIGFTIKVSNAGPGVAKGVTLSDPLPNLTGLKWTMSPSTAGCTLGATAPQTLSCAFGNMAAGTSKTVHVVSPTTAGTPGTVSNTATAAATNSGPVPPATATITVIPLTPNLHVSKSACPATAVPGGVLTYTIAYNNDGTGPATAAVLTDVVPAGTTLVDAGGGTTSTNGGVTTVTWNLGTLAAPSSGTKTMAVLVTAADGSSVVNTTTLASPSSASPATFTLTTPVSNAGAITHGSAYGADVTALALHPINKLAPAASVAPGSPAASTNALASVSLPGVIGLNLITQTAQSTLDLTATSTSTSTVAGIDVLGGFITADEVKGVSQSLATAGSASYNSLGSTFTNLKVNGTTLANVAPNTTVELKLLGITVARAVLYEEAGTSAFASNMFTASHSVNMIHVTLLAPLAGLPAGSQIIIAHAQSDATYPSGLACGTTPGSVSGEAFTVLAEGTLNGVPVVHAENDDVVLPATGGSAAVTIANLGVPFVLASTTATDSTNGSLVPSPHATSHSVVEGLNLLDGLVTADVLDVTSTSTTSAAGATTTFATTFTNLAVLGNTISVVVAPNTTISVPPQPYGIVSLVLNEQTVSNGAKDTSGTVNAIHLKVLNGGLVTLEVIVTSAHSDAHMP